MAESKRIPWPLGILVAPFMMVFVLVMAVLMCLTIAGAALIGKLTVDFTERK